MLRQKRIRAFWLTLTSWLALGALCCPQGKPPKRPDGPIAVVAGQPIYEQDLMSVAGPSLLDLHKQEYKTKRDALNQLIRRKLIEAEAKKRGLSTEELLRQEVESKIPEPSDEEAKGYYL